MRTIILCGGRGTRAYPHTAEVPKPLLEVGGVPVLEHVLRIYAAQGFDDFVLAAGYKVELVRSFAESLDEGWRVTVVDTGLDTATGERVRKCAHDIGDQWFVTYGDGLGNVDLAALLAFHRSHAGAATLTTVPLPSQYGTLDLGEEGRVVRFREKPRLPDHRINAGFFVFDRRVLDHWDGTDLEREVLPSLSRDRELFAYGHDGFWKSLDTYKDALDLDALCAAGDPPWLSRHERDPRRSDRP